jgi:pyrroline-5-carboxylate reductase
MEREPRFSIIGAGAMGEAILGGLIQQKLTKKECIFASEPRLERRQELKAAYGIHTTDDNLIAIAAADVVVLAVKPQKLEKVLTQLKDKIPANAVVISIVAGATLETLANGLGHSAIIRTMPNTPGQIGEGITVWFPTNSVNETQLENAKLMLKALGENIQVDEEYYLDMATALSGTGPMYVFLFMEALMDAGVHLGFARHISEKLVIETIRGSVDYFESQHVHVADLRNKVTSPGGTSAAALYYLEKAGFRTAISRAVWAAYERSLQLGKGKLDQPPEKTSENGVS